MKLIRVFIVTTILFVFSCTTLKVGEVNYKNLTTELSGQLKKLVSAIPKDRVPRSYPNKNGEYWMAGINDWTCGFPAGTFWMMYELTNDEYWKQVAVENTEKLDGVQYRKTTHDLGFMVFCSYGNAYRLTREEKYKKVVIDAAESLITRYNSKIGCIRSWDHGHWLYPVIIDNMMNLEMLFWTSEVTGDPKYSEIAISHADKTLENHFRSDWSSYHVVNYSTKTGKPIEKVTCQGFNDQSAWSRGQAWGLYGFTMCYRKTYDEKYLHAAENIAEFMIANLPKDMIFYWDFNDPEIPDAYRDVSAAAITASALFELGGYSKNKRRYYSIAKKIMKSLTSDKYRVSNGSNGGFILKHSVGHKMKESEVDVAINYADYYYLEALKREKNINI